VLDDMRPRLQAAGVSTGFMLTTLSTNGFLIEPVFFWPEERQALHEATVEPQVLARLDLSRGQSRGDGAGVGGAVARDRGVRRFRRGALPGGPDLSVHGQPGQAPRGGCCRR
jgi:hypothetical protein